MHILQTVWFSVCGSGTWGTAGMYMTGKSCTATARRGAPHVA
jgi:hypothetical protein